jgi:hypothetical protein
MTVPGIGPTLRPFKRSEWATPQCLKCGMMRLSLFICVVARKAIWNGCFRLRALSKQPSYALRHSRMPPEAHERPSAWE